MLMSSSVVAHDSALHEIKQHSPCCACCELAFPLPDQAGHTGACTFHCELHTPSALNACQVLVSNTNRQANTNQAAPSPYFQPVAHGCQLVQQLPCLCQQLRLLREDVLPEVHPRKYCCMHGRRDAQKWPYSCLQTTPAAHTCMESC